MASRCGARRGARNQCLLRSQDLEPKSIFFHGDTARTLCCFWQGRSEENCMLHENASFVSHHHINDLHPFHFNKPLISPATFLIRGSLAFPTAVLTAFSIP